MIVTVKVGIVENVAADVVNAVDDTVVILAVVDVDSRAVAVAVVVDAPDTTPMMMPIHVVVRVDKDGDVHISTTSVLLSCQSCLQ